MYPTPSLRCGRYNPALSEYCGTLNIFTDTVMKADRIFKYQMYCSTTVLSAVILVLSDQNINRSN